MTEREQQRLVKHRLAVIRHVEEVTGNVARACRYYGISRPTFYRWLRRYEEKGLEGLAEGVGMWAPDTCGLAASGDISVGVIRYDAEGDDSVNLNDEWVEITNEGTTHVELTGWGVKDESATWSRHSPRTSLDDRHLQQTIRTLGRSLRRPGRRRSHDRPGRPPRRSRLPQRRLLPTQRPRPKEHAHRQHTVTKTRPGGQYSPGARGSIFRRC
jgi:hypothetical protein